jgi:glyoxalase family protein
LELGLGGNGASVILDYQPLLPNAYQGYGGVHHVAFRVDDREDIDAWIRHLNSYKAGHSGFVDRFYFKSLYTRLYPGILFEYATEGPGFIDDEEPYEILGEKLALPPKFRNQRERIESLVRPIDTVRSTKEFKKEYFNDERS